MTHVVEMDRNVTLAQQLEDRSGSVHSGEQVRRSVGGHRPVHCVLGWGSEVLQASTRLHLGVRDRRTTSVQKASGARRMRRPMMCLTTRGS
jgi:hypothetical protein